MQYGQSDPLALLLREPTANNLRQTASNCIELLRSDDMYQSCQYSAAIVPLVDSLSQALLSDDNDSLKRLRVLHLAKQLLLEANYAYLVLFQAALLPWLQGICSFELHLPIEERAAMLFPNICNALRQDWLQTCQELLNLSREIVSKMAEELLPEAAYHASHIPSMFAMAQKSLRMSSSAGQAHISREEMRHFHNRYSEYDRHRQRTTEPFVSSFSAQLSNLLDRSRWRQGSQQPPSNSLNKVLALLYIGDHYLIAAAVHACQGLLSQPDLADEHKVRVLEVRRRLSQFLDSLFLLADPQALRLIKQKIVPHLIYNLLPASLETSSLLKARSSDSLRSWGHLANLYNQAVSSRVPSMDDRMYQLAFELLLDYRQKDQGPAQAVFLANIKSRMELIEAKAPEFASSTPYEDALIPLLQKRITLRHQKGIRSSQPSEILDPIVVNLPPELDQWGLAQSQHARPLRHEETPVTIDRYLPKIKQPILSQEYYYVPQLKPKTEELIEKDVRYRKQIIIRRSRVLDAYIQKHPPEEEQGKAQPGSQLVMFPDSLRQKSPRQPLKAAVSTSREGSAHFSHRKNAESDYVEPDKTVNKPQFKLRPLSLSRVNSSASKLVHSRTQILLPSPSQPSLSPIIWKPARSNWSSRLCCSNPTSTERNLELPAASGLNPQLIAAKAGAQTQNGGYSAMKQRIFLTQTYFPSEGEASHRFPYTSPNNDYFSTNGGTPQQSSTARRLLRESRFRNSSPSGGSHTRELPSSSSRSRLNIEQPLYQSSLGELLLDSIKSRKVERYRHRVEPIPVQFKKKLLKNKDCLLRSERLQVGYLCSGQTGKEVLLTLYYTSYERLLRFKTEVIPYSARVDTQNLALPETIPNAQVTQQIRLSQPTLFSRQRPVLEVRYETDSKKRYEHSLTLPYSLLRLVKYQAVTDTRRFLESFRNGSRRLLTVGPVRYDTHIIAQPISLIHMFPQMTLLDNQTRYLQFLSKGKDIVVNIFFGAGLLSPQSRKAQLLLAMSSDRQLQVWVCHENSETGLAFLQAYLDELFAVLEGGS